MSDAEEKNEKGSDEIGAGPTRSFEGLVKGPGSQIGAFRVERELGRGAVGVVYLAHDTKLDRSVAIKSLPAEVMSNPKARSRFAREARVLASLNHPNIATIYEQIEEAEGVGYLVLEYVPGQTLAERIASGPLKLQETLTIALQIAEAVAAAHEHDVIHRDLKPGNIKITPEGKVKVLDFGLAKVVGGQALDQQTTITQPGRVIGTPAYMSPEQARGRPTDKRSDIWSFGCVLYEMLSGRMPFRGETISDTLANILQTEPNLEMLPQSTPANILVLLRRCLTKDPHRRLRDIGDAGIEITETMHLPQIAPPVTSSTTVISAAASKRRLLVMGLVITTLVAIAASSITWFLKPSPSPLLYPEESVQPPYHISFPVDAREIFRICFRPIFDISPDGRRVVYTGFEGEDSPLYFWEEGKFGFRAIRGTEGATSPFFSPDGKSVGFLDEGKLKVVSLEGVLTDLEVEAPGFRGASWGKDGILLTPALSGGLILVPTDGEKSKPVTVAEPNRSKKESNLRWPHLLPGGEAAIITVKTADISSFDEAKLAWLDLKSGKYHYLQNIQGTYPRYHEASGHLIYASGGQILAVPLDLEKKEVRGRSVKIVDDVLQSINGYAHFDIAGDGTLIYIKASPEFYKWKLALRDRDGNTIRTTTDYYTFINPSVSPDGDRMVVEIAAANDYLSICPLNNLTPTTLFKGWENWRPIWTPEGDYLTFSRNHEGVMNLYQIPVNDASPSNIERLTTQLSTKPRYPTSWSPDGNYLLFMQVDLESTGYDIYILSSKNKEEKAIISTPDDEWGAIFSPDGKYIVYSSDREGRPEVFIRQFVSPDTSLGPPIRISTEGGLDPTWSFDGNEIFFLNDNKMWSVRLEFESGVYKVKADPERLFEVDPYSTRFNKQLRQFEVTSDCQFIMQDMGEKDSLLDEIYVENFEKLLERRKQSGRDF